MTKEETLAVRVAQIRGSRHLNGRENVTGATWGDVLDHLGVRRFFELCYGDLLNRPAWEVPFTMV